MEWFKKLQSTCNEMHLHLKQGHNQEIPSEVFTEGCHEVDQMVGSVMQKNK